MINNKMIYIIFDSEFGNTLNGDLFKDGIINLPGLSFYPFFYKQAIKKNILCLTKKQFLSNTTLYNKNILLGFSYEGKKDNINFFKKYNIIPFIIFTGEAPLSSKNFYRNINNRVNPFLYYFGFSGSKFLLNTKNIEKFHQYYWPNKDVFVSGETFHNRRLITFISSAKHKMPANFNNKISIIIRHYRYYTNKIKSVFEKKYLGDDLLQFRNDAIKYFAQNEDFQLFGKGWDSNLKYDSFLSKIIFKNKPTVLISKITEINNSKFTFCFENTSYPGYITEKIFDIFLADSVPIWKGTKDIYVYIPSNCIIDCDKFNNFNDLYNHIKNIDENEWNNYRNNIKLFLLTESYKNFTELNFSNKIINLITKDFQ